MSKKLGIVQLFDYSYGQVVVSKPNTIWVGKPLNNVMSIKKVLKYFEKEMQKDETVQYTAVPLSNGYTGFQLTMLYGLTFNELTRMTPEQIRDYNLVNDTSHIHPKERFN